MKSKNNESRESWEFVLDTTKQLEIEKLIKNLNDANKTQNSNKKDK
ncbi:hypothetical protein [Brachyspira pulli]